MCNYCKEGLNTLIEDYKISNMIWWAVSNGRKASKEDIDEIDNSVCLQTRNGYGYIRIGDRDDMQCLDSDKLIRINYCPMCGKAFENK